MRTEAEMLVDCLERLNRLKLAYMLTGSMASSYWGRPRTSDDLDFVLTMRPEDLPTFVVAFEAGFFIQPESVRRALNSLHQFNVIDEDSTLKADFWFLSNNEYDRRMFERRTLVTYFSTPAWIATAEDVILHKLYWNGLTPSDRQLQDAAGVFSVQAGSLDRSYMHEWAKTLGVSKELDDIFAGRIKPKST